MYRHRFLSLTDAQAGYIIDQVLVRLAAHLGDLLRSGAKSATMPLA